MKTDEIIAIKQSAEKEFHCPGGHRCRRRLKRVGRRKRTDEIAIVVYVREKKPLSKVAEKQRVPELISGRQDRRVERTSSSRRA